MNNNSANYENGFYNQTVHYYDECASLYDYLYPDHLRYSKSLFKILKPMFLASNVNKILDASCGVGHDMTCLIEQGFTVDGADICPHMVEEAKWRLRKNGDNVSQLYQTDVRILSNVVGTGKYDAVVFRGNTFSNIHPEEHDNVISELIKVLKVNGTICIDFRNGSEQFKNKRKFEFRGFGYSKNNNEMFISYYIYKHSNNINKPYDVFAYIWKLKYNHICCSKINIKSHYVDEDNIIKSLNRKNIDFQVINIKRGGLRFIKTLFCDRKD